MSGTGPSRGSLVAGRRGSLVCVVVAIGVLGLFGGGLAQASASKHPRCVLLRTSVIRATLDLASLSGPDVKGSTCFYPSGTNPAEVIISNFRANLHTFQRAKARAKEIDPKDVHPLYGFGKHAFFTFSGGCIGSSCPSPQYYAYGLTVLKGSSMVVASAANVTLNHMEALMRKLLAHV